jgi:hypothetical protein
LLREWTGHDFAGDSAPLLAEILAHGQAAIMALGKGRTRWFTSFISDDRVRRFLGFNEHEGETWLNRESLETLLTAMVISGLTAPVPSRPASLLDGRALIEKAAEEAGFAVSKMQQLLTGK